MSFTFSSHLDTIVLNYKVEYNVYSEIYICDILIFGFVINSSLIHKLKSFNSIYRLHPQYGKLLSFLQQVFKSRSLCQPQHRLWFEQAYQKVAVKL